MDKFAACILDSAPPRSELEFTDELLTIIVVIVILIIFSVIRIIKAKKKEDGENKNY